MSEDNQSDKGSVALNPDGAATAGAVEIVKRKRGRPAGSTNSGIKAGGTESGASGELAAKQAQLQEQFSKLYAPEAWEGIMAAPADIMLAFSGDAVWDVSEKERKTLGIHASLTAQCFAVQNPKWLALTMLGMSLTTVYLSRTMEYLARKQEKKNELENRPPKTVAHHQV